MQQDAHEFLNYLLNEIAEILEKHNKEKRSEERKKEESEGSHSLDESFEEDKNSNGTRVIEGADL